MASISVNHDGLVEAYHQVSGEQAYVPEHWLGDDSPFPGQWGKKPPTPAQSRAAEKAVAKSNSQEG